MEDSAREEKLTTVIERCFPEHPVERYRTDVRNRARLDQRLLSRELEPGKCIRSVVAAALLLGRRPIEEADLEALIELEVRHLVLEADGVADDTWRQVAWVASERTAVEPGLLGTLPESLSAFMQSLDEALAAHPSASDSNQLDRSADALIADIRRSPFSVTAHSLVKLVELLKKQTAASR